MRSPSASRNLWPNNPLYRAPRHRLDENGAKVSRDSKVDHPAQGFRGLGICLMVGGIQVVYDMR
jgi:hypothetical protein